MLAISAVSRPYSNRLKGQGFAFGRQQPGPISSLKCNDGTEFEIITQTMRYYWASFIRFGILWIQ